MYDTVLHVQRMSTGNNCLRDTLLNRQGWYIDTDKEWIPAFAGRTD